MIVLCHEQGPFFQQTLAPREEGIAKKMEKGKWWEKGGRVKTDPDRHQAEKSSHRMGIDGGSSAGNKKLMAPSSLLSA